MTLGEFLDSAAARPFRPGEHDCCLFLADWVRERMGVDPAPHLRGRYRTRLGYARILLLHGGFVATVGGCAARVGLERTKAPVKGDIGVILARTLHTYPEPVGAICVGAAPGGLGWACLTPGGLMIGASGFEAAWGVA